MSNEKLQPYETKMQKSLDALEREYTTIRAGRANPHILDKLKVDYYGTPTPLQQVGNVTVPEARVLMIQPWESKLIKDIEKAILWRQQKISDRDGLLAEGYTEDEIDSTIELYQEEINNLKSNYDSAPEKYEGTKDADVGDEQFEINDSRSFESMYQDMEQEGLQPVLNDYLYV